MASKMTEMFSGGDAKSRVFVVVATIVAIVGVVYVGSKMMGSTKATGQAKLAGAPALQSVPGGNVTPEYYRALMKANEQSAKQAEITGTSAVPTMVSAPGETQTTVTTTNNNCVVACPGTEATVDEDVNAMVRDGKLNAADANQLASLAKSNVPVSEYADYLTNMVKQGKLTPAEARKLLDDYTRQHATAQSAPSAQLMDNLIKSGKMSLEAANGLLALQKQNVSPADYQAALDKLVRDGKLSPDAAAQLMAQYNHQLSQAAAAEGANQLQQMLKSGQITPEVAADLQALQKRAVPISEYAAELNRLVAEGKLTPAAAAKLLAQYKAQGTAGASTLSTVDPAAQLADMVQTGEVPADVANDLLNLQKNNVPASDYKAELDKLVAAGKISPATAAKLLQQYTEAHNGAGPAGTLNGLLTAAQAQNAGGIVALAAAGKISRDVASQLTAMQKKNVPPQAYADAIDALVHAGKLPPEAAQQLKDNYNKLYGIHAEAGKLIDMQANNVTPEAYKAELMNAVRQHLVDPATAAKLLQQYQALSAPPPVIAPVAPGAGVNPAIASNVPGAQDFAVLQQRIAAEQANRPVPTAATTNGVDEEAQFAQEEAAAEAEAMRARQQKIQELMGQMANQAQQLVSAWAPPHMEHKGGSTSDKKGTTGEGGLTPSQNNAKNAANKAEGIDKPPLLKAGSILFAVLTTAVDSDYPDTPVMATIVSGPFKGAILLGKLALANGQDKVSLNFTMMNRDDWIKTKTVSAFAIDPDTARTVMASSVDKHYWLRYGTLFASSFVTGYANGITTSGSTTTSGIFGTSSTHPQLSPGEKFAVGLGQVGSAFGTALQSYVNTPTTVKVNSGVGLGILFMADVT